MTVKVTKSTKVARREESPEAALEKKKGWLEQLAPQIERALPAHLPADRFMRVVLTTVRQSPALQKADPFSLMASVMTAAQLGLEPDGVLGHGYLVPFKGKVQFIPGYRGYIALARNSGEIENIAAECVYEGDHFDYELGLNDRLEHKPTMGDRGEMTHVYAFAKYKGGGHSFVVLTRADCEKIREQFSASFRKYGEKADTPWVTHFEAMARKTAVRRLSNVLPLSVQRAAALDRIFEGGAIGKLDEYGEAVVDVTADQLSESTEDDEQETAEIVPEETADGLSDEEKAEIKAKEAAEAEAELEAQGVDVEAAKERKEAMEGMKQKLQKALDDNEDDEIEEVEAPLEEEGE